MKDELQKLRKKTKADLQKDLDGSREELRSLRFDLATGKVKNIVKIKEAKRKIARILTLMSEMHRKESENQSSDE